MCGDGIDLLAPALGVNVNFWPEVTMSDRKTGRTAGETRTKSMPQSLLLTEAVVAISYTKQRSQNRQGAKSRLDCAV
jgi:hypothetical protein